MKTLLLNKLSYILLCVLPLLLIPISSKAQGVGVVLSGGGGSAMAHIGVLKALEENEIPIDCITGSSMGALVGALYSAGYTPEEIEAMVSSEGFQAIADGELETQFSYYFKQNNIDPSYIRFKIKPDQPIFNSLPTHIYNSQQLDFYLMTLFAGAEAASAYNFDSLMIPFRCIASDIYKKESKVFSNGNVGEAVRASMTYPFYLQALSIDSVLYFDGGLYDNFPKDLMEETFDPDFIIGSNVSSNPKEPEEDVLFSQLENMLAERTDYSIDPEDGILINIKIDVGTFDLSSAGESIAIGYEETLKKIPDIKAKLGRSMSEAEFDQRRNRFNAQKLPLEFESVQIKGLDKSQTNYLTSSFTQSNKIEDLESVERLYYKIYADNKIKFIYPKATLNEETGKYVLHLDIIKDKNMEIQIGGILSTSPINTGYAALKYTFFRKTPISVGVNGYFGNVYQSAKLSMKLEVPSRLPFYWEPFFVINSYDYFKNRVSVFDEVQPPFIITNELYLGNSFGFPFILNTNLSLDYKYFQERYTYYSNPDFTLKDTSDNTQLYAHTIGITISKYRYDFKQYPSEGSNFYLDARFVTGDENSSWTNPQGEKFQNNSKRNWLQIYLEYYAFPLSAKWYSLGLGLEGYFSNQPDFSNYFGTIIAAKPFQPLTESITLFQPTFRSTAWLSVGMQNVFKPMKNVQIRLEGYIFQPAFEITADEDARAKRGDLFDSRYLILSAAIVYHTKLGPISLNGNYYQNSFPETSLLLNFGYTIFNKNARD